MAVHMLLYGTVLIVDRKQRTKKSGTMNCDNVMDI